MQTLYESWQLRRQLVETSPARIPSVMQEQRRILDWLLSRYGNDEASRAGAFFPARAELLLNRRVVVVHDHIGRGTVSGTRNVEEATHRASSILQRIARVDPQASAQAPGHRILSDPEPYAPPTLPPAAIAKGGIASEGISDVEPLSVTFRQRLAWGRITTAIRAGEEPATIVMRIRAALALGPTLPKIAVTFLFEQCEKSEVKNTAIADLLQQCNNASVPAYAMIAWRNRLVAYATGDPVGNVLRQTFLKPELRKITLDLLRPYLADVNAVVRIHTVRLLRELGSLHDVGLLLDLCSLPAQPDEAAGERAELLAAAAHLSGMPSEQVQRDAVSAN